MFYVHKLTPEWVLIVSGFNHTRLAVTVMSKTLAYCATELMTVVEGYVVQA